MTMAVTVSLTPSFSARARGALRNSSTPRDVGLVVLRDVRRLPGGGQMLGRLAADVRHRPHVDRAPLREVRQRRAGRGRAAARAAARHDALHIRGHVVLADSAARARTRDVGDVHAEFARVAPDRRRRGHAGAGRDRGRRRRFGARRRAGAGDVDDVRLLWCRPGRVRLSGRCRSGRAAGAAASLRPASVSLGRRGRCRGLGARRTCSACRTRVVSLARSVDDQNDLPDLDLVAGLTRTSTTLPPTSARHFDRGLVGFELDDRLIVLDRRRPRSPARGRRRLSRCSRQVRGA